jgi:hypothetical protein
MSVTRGGSSGGSFTPSARFGRDRDDLRPARWPSVVQQHPDPQLRQVTHVFDG